jgi:hypothetical protein
MKLINNSKSSFKTSRGVFPIGSIIDFEDNEARTLLKYNGVIEASSLEIKEEAPKKTKKESSKKADEKSIKED